MLMIHNIQWNKAKIKYVYLVSSNLVEIQVYRQDLERNKGFLSKRKKFTIQPRVIYLIPGRYDPQNSFTL